MTNASAPSASAMGESGSMIGILRRAMRTDVAFAIGILAIIAMLILPLPTWLLDVALSLSIAFAVLVLMTALFIKHPLEFSAFPTVLLIATMLRLGLNIASTRLILSEGQTGSAAAGDIIAAFGAFVMQGNFVIGVIVFAILVIVNFVVITKGSGRIAEVGARFSLDAMPGKQMAIDADLSAGLIDEATARARRKTLEAESNFFGSMDGASKFVRGDAIAGLLITGINLIAGVIIGMAQHGISAGDALNTYATLTVGDGLVSQIPALIISIAAGLLVSKAGVDGAADQALVGQLTGYPQGLAMVSGVCAVAGIMPGMPTLVFLPLAVLTAWAAWKLRDRKPPDPFAVAAGPAAGPTGAAAGLPVGATTEGEAEPDPAKPDEPIAQTLAIDDLRIELGYGLLPLINESDGRKLTDQIVALRKQLAKDMGFVTPSVRIIDNAQLSEQGYMLRVKEMEAGGAELRLGKLLAMDPGGREIDMPGEAVKEPAFGLAARWIEESHREEATFRGYTVVDPATVLVTHLTEVIKDNMAELLTFTATQDRLDELSEAHQDMLKELQPAAQTRATVQRVLQSLLRERVSIRDLPSITEAIVEVSGHTKDMTAITEHVRMRLSRQLCHAHRGPDGMVPVLALSPEWEHAMAEAMIGDGAERQLALAPSQLHQFINAARNAFDSAGRTGLAPVLLTGPVIRPYVRSLTERFLPQLTVMGQNEIHPKAKLRQVGSV